MLKQYCRHKCSFIYYTLQYHCKILLRWQKCMTSFVFDNSFEFYVVPECWINPTSFNT